MQKFYKFVKFCNNCGKRFFAEKSVNTKCVECLEKCYHYSQGGTKSEKDRTAQVV